MICSFLIYYYQAPPRQNTVPLSASPGQTATLLVNSVKYESQIAEPMSVYDFMTQLQNEGKITFKDTAYVGLGKFIEEINGIKGAGGRNWIYYVNGKKAEVGVSNYKINPGDVVSWKYE